MGSNDESEELSLSVEALMVVGIILVTVGISVKVSSVSAENVEETEVVVDGEEVLEVSSVWLLSSSSSMTKGLETEIRKLFLIHFFFFFSFFSFLFF